MKAIYLSAALFIFSVPAMAQNKSVLPGLEMNSLLTWNQQIIKQGFNLSTYSTIKLPQNNMPCFVPDVSAIAVMPVLKTVSGNQAIPNPYFNYNNQPENTANSFPR